MRRLIGVGLPLLIAFSFPSVNAAEDIVMKVMRDELGRSMEQLRLGKLEKPYFIAYKVGETTRRTLSAHFGSLVTNNETRRRFLTVEVRVGDYSLDNTNFLTMPSGPTGVVRSFGGTVQLPLEDDYKELRRQIWLATDSAYKKAVEDFARKRAVLENMTRSDEVHDFSKEEPATSKDEAAPVAGDLAQAEALVRDLSALFKGAPGISSSSVRLEWGNLRIHYVNSEGTSFTRLKPSVVFKAIAATQAPDGLPLEDFVAFFGRSMSDLPPKEKLEAGIREMSERLSKLREAPILDRYSGPVLMEGQAVAELFSQVFAPNLLGLRRPVSDNPQLQMFSSQMENPFLDKVGGRVLPEFLSLVDDPTVSEYNGTPLAGAYRVDADGVPARAKRLVEKGILKTLLTSRNPVRGITRSTGNRRGANTVPSCLFLTTDNGLSDEEMKAKFLELLKQRGKEYGVVVQRIGNPQLRARRAPMFMGPPGMRRNRVEGITVAYKVFPDGREELVRNAEFSGMSAATFKDIIAASQGQTVYNAPFQVRITNPFSRSRGRSLVSLVVPSLLFEDVTLKKPEGEVPKPPVLKHPFF